MPLFPFVKISFFPPYINGTNSFIVTSFTRFSTIRIINTQTTTKDQKTTTTTTIVVVVVTIRPSATIIGKPNSNILTTRTTTTTTKEAISSLHKHHRNTNFFAVKFSFTNYLPHFIKIIGIAFSLEFELYLPVSCF